MRLSVKPLWTVVVQKKMVCICALIKLMTIRELYIDASLDASVMSLHDAVFATI